VYDDGGEVTTKQDALGNRVTMSYDNPGRLLTRLDGRGLTTTLSYDAAGRRTGIQCGDGTRATFTYDSLGRVETMADGSGTTTFGYDDASRQTLVVFPGGKRVTYTFDDGGRRATLVDPDGLTTTYGFDNANRLTGLMNGASERTTWAYDSASRLTTLTLANGATVTYSYDSASRISGVRNAKADDTAISGFAYTRDDVGNPTAATLANGDLMTFTYDDGHRLTREQRNGTNGYDMTYTFDAVGNRTTKVTGGVTTTFTFNDADQLTVQNAGGTLTTLSFDAAGNNTVVNAAGARTTYAWDMADRLTGIAAGGGLVTMGYSATGLRRVRQDGSGTVKYLWDGQVPLMETDGDGTTTARYTGATDPYGPVVSQRRGSTSRFFHPNDLGTFDTLTDPDAATTDTYILDAWGVQHASSGSTTNPFRYIGALGYYTEPDLGLAYVRARWLRPGTASWLSVDPVAGEMRYAYVGGRATRAVDSLGSQAEWGPPPKTVPYVTVPIDRPNYSPCTAPDRKDCEIQEAPVPGNGYISPGYTFLGCGPTTDNPEPHAIGRVWILVDYWGTCREKCTIAHEASHYMYKFPCYEAYCKCVNNADQAQDPAARADCINKMKRWVEENEYPSECRALEGGIGCVQFDLTDPTLSPECRADLEEYLTQLRARYGEIHCTPDVQGTPCPFS